MPISWFSIIWKYSKMIKCALVQCIICIKLHAFFHEVSGKVYIRYIYYYFWLRYNIYSGIIWRVIGCAFCIVKLSSIIHFLRVDCIQLLFYAWPLVHSRIFSMKLSWCIEHIHLYLPFSPTTYWYVITVILPTMSYTLPCLCPQIHIVMRYCMKGLLCSSNGNSYTN